MPIEFGQGVIVSSQGSRYCVTSDVALLYVPGLPEVSHRWLWVLVVTLAKHTLWPGVIDPWVLVWATTVSLWSPDLPTHMQNVNRATCDLYIDLLTRMQLC